MDVTAARRASAAAQTILRESNPSLVIDGKFGSFTKATYDKADARTRADVDGVVRALGFPAGVESLYSQYKVAKSTGSGQTVFDLQVVPAVVREARRRGLNPAFAIGQLALESGWGKAVPLTADGRSSNNFGGIKWATDQTSEFASSQTKEATKSGGLVSIVDRFAVYSNADEFAKAYFRYLYDTSKHYPGLAQAKTADAYAKILQDGGYAGKDNKQYAVQLVGVIRSAERRYDLA